MGDQLAVTFFILYALFIAGVYVSRSKAQALSFNALCCLSCSVYLYLMGGYAGVVACIAAALGSLYQLYVLKSLTVLSNQKQLLLYKSIGCVLFTIVGVSAVYQSPADLLLVVAIVSCRGSEMLESNHAIKLGYLLAEALWFLYAAYNQLLGMYTIHFVMICLGLFTIYIYPHIKKHSNPLPSVSRQN